MRIVVKVFLLLSVLSLFFFSPQFYFPFIVSKVFWFRFFVEIALLAWLIDVAQHRVVRFRFTEPIVAAVSIFVGALTLAAVWGVNPAFSMWSNFERSEGLFSLLHYFAFFLLLLDVATIDDCMNVVRVLIYASPFAAFYRISSAINFGTHTFERVSGVFGNPSYLAGFLIFVFAFIGLLMLRNSAHGRRSKDALPYAENYLLGCVAVVDLIAFVLTQTRGAYIGLFAGLFVYGGFLLWKGTERRERMLGIGLLVVLLGTVLTGLVVLRGKSTPFSGLDNLSTFTLRVATWKAAWKGFLERPLIGYGPENFSVIFDKHYDPIHSGIEIWFDHAHSIVFDLLATSGILGFLAYCFIFFALYRWYVSRILKRNSAMVSGIYIALPVAYLVQNLVLFDTFSSYLSFFVFLVLARHAAVGGEEQSTKKNTPQSLPKYQFNASFVFFVVVTVLAVMSIWALYENSAAYHKNQELAASYFFVRQSSLAEGVSRFESMAQEPSYLGHREVEKELSVYLYSWVASFDSKEIEQNIPALDKGLAMIDVARKQDPQYLLLDYVLGKTYQLLGTKLSSEAYIKKAEIVLREANAKSPNRIETLDALTSTLLMEQDYNDARTFASQIVALRPDMEVGHRLLGITYYELHDLAHANPELIKALTINPSSTAARYLK
ncbi:MAG: O-antigen ligase family protein [Patescibacteria group bacterium]|nr:O-antigen ligase family protein [Patescibacteria group bacterium]MDE2438536.1 O-antigen ligase family protein [Patescibacteria group bacterium]